MITKVFLIVLLLFTLCIRPVLSLAFLVLKPFSFIKKRLQFERKNTTDPASFYFDKINNRFFNKTDFCFFVSSEGEFEQVVPLIEEALLQSHAKLEIVYTSESVDRKIHDFQTIHKERVQVLRLPLMLFFPMSFLVFQPLWSWVKAKKIVLCRYDFFPEILLFKLFGKKLILVSATVKNKEIHFFRKIFLKAFYPIFDEVFFASNTDKEKLTPFLGNREFPVFDFRVQRILNRLEGKEQKLVKEKKLSQFLSSMKSDQSLIVGSLWKSDADILFSKENLDFYKSKNISLFIFPHKLKDLGLSDYVNHLISSKIPFKKIQNLEELQNFNQHSFENASVYYIDIGGILVEMYSYFKLAYVGGGFERSIHSVLEPYVAGCRVITGPKTHRSTEWDLVSQDQLYLSHCSIQASADLLKYLENYFNLDQKIQFEQIESSKNYQTLLQWNRDKTASFIKQLMID